MKKITTLVIGAALLSSCCNCAKETTTNTTPALKSFTDKYFYLGAAINTDHIIGADLEGVATLEHHFSSISPENCLKPEEVHPSENVYEWTIQDAYVDLGERNKMFVHGHTLVWHSQCPDWFFFDEKGDTASYDLLKTRLESHIATVVGRYKGRIHSWDVINESVVEGGLQRQSMWYKILGDDLYEIAFSAAAKADPEAKLYLNDYNMTDAGRRERYVEIVKRLQSKGIKIDGMGMQGHWHLTRPEISEIQKTIDMFAELGLKVSISELDMTILPRRQQGITAAVDHNEAFEQSLDPYKGNFPQEPLHDWNYRMQEFFQLFKDNADKIERVTVWGVCDQDSWLNNWPIQGRYDYATLFTRNHRIKPVDFWIMKNY